MLCRSLSPTHAHSLSLHEVSDSSNALPLSSSQWCSILLRQNSCMPPIALSLTLWNGDKSMFPWHWVFIAHMQRLKGEKTPQKQNTHSCQHSLILIFWSNLPRRMGFLFLMLKMRYSVDLIVWQRKKIVWTLKHTYCFCFPKENILLLMLNCHCH